MRRLQLFITVVFLLFVFATPSFAVAGPTYDEDNLALINAVNAGINLTQTPVEI